MLGETALQPLARDDVIAEARLGRLQRGGPRRARASLGFAQSGGSATSRHLEQGS
jgi:hypothetical protein